MATTQGKEYANGNEKTRIPSLFPRRPDIPQHRKSLSISTVGPPDRKCVPIPPTQKHVPTLSSRTHVPTPSEERHVQTSAVKKHVTKKHVPTSSAEKHVPASSAKKHAPTSSSGEHFPNYLRPTKCSGHALSMHSKKQLANNAAHKPNLNRRSFDNKPALPSSALHKAPTSQNPREKKLEPLSISPKATTLLRSHSLNLPKTQRNIAKPMSIQTRPVAGKKGANTFAKKQNSPNSTAAKIKAPSSGSADVAMTQQPKSPHEDQKSSVTDVGEEVVKFENSFNDFPNEILILEDKGQVLDLVESEHGMDIDEELRSFESFNVLEHENASFSLEMGQSIDETNVEGAKNNYIHERGDHGKEDKVNCHPEDQSFVVGPKFEGEARKIEEDATENSSGRALDAKEVVGEGSRNNEKEVADANEVVDEGSLNSEKEVVEDIAKEEKAGKKNVAVKQQVAKTKEDSAANNEVTEEPPRKPVQKRRNKVSALVGAFENVVS